MAKPKASTLQARFGFLDEDLKTSDHDEIMSWLDANSKMLIEKILQWQSDWDKEQVAQLQRVAKSAIANQINEWKATDSERLKRDGIDIKDFESWKGLGEPPVKPPLEIEVIWEHTVSGANNFIVGFIDMKAVVYESGLDVENIVRLTYSQKYMLQSRPKEKFFVPSWFVENRTSKNAYYFEVKSTLPSLGELIRQIRMYQEFVKGKFFVVAPDSKYAQQLQKQGIGFIKYPEGQVLG